MPWDALVAIHDHDGVALPDAVIHSGHLWRPPRGAAGAWLALSAASPPPPKPSGRRAAAAASFHAPAELKEPPMEEKTRSVAAVTQAHLPNHDRLDDLNTTCKTQIYTKDFDMKMAGKPAKGLGHAVEKSSVCVEGMGDVMLKGLFGTKLEAGKEQAGVGVMMDGTHDLPIGGLARKQYNVTEKACGDFATWTLHALGKPGEDTKATLSSKDAAAALRHFGLCLDNIGEQSALQACEMGQLKSYGSREVAHVCEEVEGPTPVGVPCSIL